jgi:hypothetical protein
MGGFSTVKTRKRLNVSNPKPPIIEKSNLFVGIIQPRKHEGRERRMNIDLELTLIGFFITDVYWTKWM